MNKDFKIPPRLVNAITPPIQLSQYLSELIGRSFKITGKTRTDGSNVRKLIASVLEKYPLPKLAEQGQYEVVPPKEKECQKLQENLLTHI